MPDLEKLQHRATVGLDFPRIGPKIPIPPQGTRPASERGIWPFGLC